MSAAEKSIGPATPSPRAGSRSQEVVVRAASHELLFGVVGPIGAGASEIADSLLGVLKQNGFDVHHLKAREVIAAWGKKNDPDRLKGITNENSWEYISALQDLGDKMRSGGDNAAVAAALVKSVRSARASATGRAVQAGVAVQPNQVKRAFILDSLRHPAEVEFLQALYRAAFVLIGVVCDEDERERRITKNLTDAGEVRAKELMRRDAKGEEEWGQRVSDTFHRADFFVDNRARRMVEKDGRSVANESWDVPDQLSRLVKLLARTDIVRPNIHEFAMYEAHGARMRSACLSRQVGAALVNARGEVVATGVNDVPRGGGGIYTSIASDDLPEPDHRCAYRDEKYCSNNREQRKIVEELLKALRPAYMEAAAKLTSSVPEAEMAWTETARPGMESALLNSRISGLLEFSRAVHAEMDALIAAARDGASVVGGRLYVTTYPCHYCARHLVAAGIDEVQYIEPYAKSLAGELHPDAITGQAEGWTAPSATKATRTVRRLLTNKETESQLTPPSLKVLIRPFRGVAPRLYERMFLKDSDLKNKKGDLQIQPSGWGEPWNTHGLSYPQLEAELAKAMEEEK